MRVLITGAGGNLGRCVAPVLERAGHQLRLFDFRPLETRHESVEGDVRDAGAVAAAMTGVDAVVHAAALHGIHLGTWSDRDFWSTNVDGAFTVYDAARRACSSATASGCSSVAWTTGTSGRRSTSR